MATSQRTIFVIGSSNTDMVVKSPRIPMPGETILGGEFMVFQGGKGANQAVAASRLGGSVTFVTSLGSDSFGDEALKGFQREGMDITFVTRHPSAATGVALISVDDQGRNSIVVAPGANAKLGAKEAINALESTRESKIILMQLEIPMDTIEKILKESSTGDIRILNPAPAAKIPLHWYPRIQIITPNETEASLLTGINVIDLKSATKSAEWFHEQGVQIVVITLGEKGAFVSDGKSRWMTASPQVHAIDSTAAGDCFNGALAVALAENKNLETAVQWACEAASISVTRMGAQVSMPLRKELKP
ncbi:MAG: ribokinase [Bacteroidetes bacterium]|nr:ribokinase [Bacteroidota bacterium]